MADGVSVVGLDTGIRLLLSDATGLGDSTTVVGEVCVIVTVVTPFCVVALTSAPVVPMTKTPVSAAAFDCRSSVMSLANMSPPSSRRTLEPSGVL
ncbi:MAG: hypothetical protein E6I20_03880 [Chloroflexi bacterium]|nr:MAG: hypothetical protein E6I20_03880 [Chloroflexota bacterium]